MPNNFSKFLTWLEEEGFCSTRNHSGLLSMRNPSKLFEKHQEMDGIHSVNERKKGTFRK
jgi:hypothetical protein